MVNGCRVRRRLARAARLYAVAVVVNVGVASSAGDGSARRRPAVVRHVEACRGLFEPQEMAAMGVIITVPLSTVEASVGDRRARLN